MATFKRHEIAEMFACHYGPAIVGAVVAAASLAAQQAAAAKQRRDQQNAAQAAKQGMASTSSGGPSVASAALGQLGAVAPTAKDLVSKAFKPKGETGSNPTGVAQSVSGAAGDGLAPTQPSPPSLPQGSGIGAGMGGAADAMGGMGLQQAAGGGGQSLQDILQQLQASGGAASGLSFGGQ